MLSFIFLHGFRLNTEGNIKCLEEAVLLEESTSNNITPHYATQVKEPSIGCEKISATSSPLTSGHLTPQFTILCVRHSWARDEKNSTQEEKWIVKAKIIAADYQKGLQEIPK